MVLNINGQISAFSPRSFQNMSLFYGDTSASLNNRKDFLNTIGIDYRDLVCAKQIHSSCISYVKEEDRGKGALFYEDAIADTDALVTDKRNLPLAVFTADCLSIFLYDPAAPAIGLVHAGWRSSRENITAKTVKFLQDKFNSKPSGLYVGFGPAIRDCCYEVGEDFNDSFLNNIIKRDNRYYLDLISLNKSQLLALGVRENNIFDSGVCTCCRNDESFSYRKEGKSCGRIISVLMLK
jgi:YfiH family protein